MGTPRGVLLERLGEALGTPWEALGTPWEALGTPGERLGGHFWEGLRDAMGGTSQEGPTARPEALHDVGPRSLLT